MNNLLICLHPTSNTIMFQTSVWPALPSNDGGGLSMAQRVLDAIKINIDPIGQSILGATRDETWFYPDLNSTKAREAMLMCFVGVKRLQEVLQGLQERSDTVVPNTGPKYDLSELVKRL